MECSNPQRKVLYTSVAAICSDAGYESTERASLETLTEMMQSFICEVGRSSRSFCELAGRTEPVIADVILALTEMGIRLEGLDRFVKQGGHTTLPVLTQITQPKQISILHAGEQKPHPSYVPDHLPGFPDPHSYIATPTHKQPVTEYEAIREKAATQKRDIERALTRFIAKIGETESLFLTEDVNNFPLSAVKVLPNPYLSALIPKDKLVEDEDFVPRKKVKRHNEENDEEHNEEKVNDSIESDVIDNPYLRPVKLPRTKKKK